MKPDYDFTDLLEQAKRIEREKMAKEYKSTMVEMVEELEKIQPRHPEIEKMITEAKAGEYHDYKNDLYDCGKVASSTILYNIARMYPDIAEACTKIRMDIQSGVYDEQADEEDKKMLDEMTAGLPEDFRKKLGL